LNEAEAVRLVRVNVAFRNIPLSIDPFYLVLESADGIGRALACGVRLVQLRVKSASESSLRAEILRARELCAAHGAQLFINDHWRLAIDLGCAHVHLGQEDLKSADIAAIRSAGLTLGVSTQSEEELETALAIGADCVALQPVFATGSKAFDRPPQGLRQLRKWKDRLGDRPLIAIGGIGLRDAEVVFDAGADCVAVISDVARNPDPDRRAREWVEATRKFARTRV
jgi:thiamine-phosphate pyrophosphorylase